jgi:protoporphyrinogen oxidase
MVLVYLVVPRPQYTPFDAHYFPSLDVTTSRLSEPMNYRDGNDPSDRTVLCAELPCWPGDETWSADDADLGARVADDLTRAGLPDPDAVEVVVRRLRSVYPVYGRSTAAARATVDRWSAALPGVLSFGRQGLGVPDNLHHVLDMGLRAAAHLGAASGDEDARRRWDDELARFATNVVVD